MKSLNTKSVLTALVIVLLATPAFSQGAHRHSQATSFQTSSIDQVVLDGRVIGSDPDPRIRSELLRGYSSLEGD